MSRASGQLPLQVFGTRADAAASRRRPAGAYLSLVLFGVFMAVALVALMVGTRAYAHLANQQAQADRARLGVDLLVNNVRAVDAQGCVDTGEGPEGPALVLVERLESGTYETRIYLYQGSVVEEYAVAGAPYAPGKATRVVQSETFGFSLEGGLLSIQTDAGTAVVALRSEGGGR